MTADGAAQVAGQGGGQRGSMLTAGIHGFPIEMPVLSRGSADRSEDLRDAGRTARAWRDARVITVDEGGRTAMQTTDEGITLAYQPASDFGPTPHPEAVLLGTVAIPDAERSHGGPTVVDYWALDGSVEVGGELWTMPGSPADPSTLREVGGLLSDTDAGLMVAAVAVLNWHRAGSFCPRCGQKSVAVTAGWSRMCPNGHQEFPRTDPAVIVLVHDGADRMVLARQPSWPPGRVSVLAGFTEAGESLEGTVAREISEEVGLNVSDIGYLGSQPWPFPRSLMVGFAARADGDAPLHPRDGEIESARWVDRATVRRVLDAGGYAEGIHLPPGISIARRMVEGWAALD